MFDFHNNNHVCPGEQWRQKCCGDCCYLFFQKSLNDYDHNDFRMITMISAYHRIKKICFNKNNKLTPIRKEIVTKRTIFRRLLIMLQYGSVIQKGLNSHSINYLRRVKKNEIYEEKPV